MYTVVNNNVEITYVNKFGKIILTDFDILHYVNRKCGINKMQSFNYLFIFAHDTQFPRAEILKKEWNVSVKVTRHRLLGNWERDCQAGRHRLFTSYDSYLGVKTG